jgi:hypothetical protein
MEPDGSLNSLFAAVWQRSPSYGTYIAHAHIQWRTEGGFDKAEPNSQFRGKYIRNNLITIRVSPICKLSGTPD